eukprot:scaffold7679_cov403-Prasinococcus_capsulatus_cf.AAC.7
MPACLFWRNSRITSSDGPYPQASGPVSKVVILYDRGMSTPDKNQRPCKHSEQENKLLVATTPGRTDPASTNFWKSSTAPPPAEKVQIFRCPARMQREPSSAPDTRGCYLPRCSNHLEGCALWHKEWRLRGDRYKLLCVGVVAAKRQGSRGCERRTKDCAAAAHLRGVWATSVVRAGVGNAEAPKTVSPAARTLTTSLHGQRAVPRSWPRMLAPV